MRNENRGYRANVKPVDEIAEPLVEAEVVQPESELNLEPPTNEPKKDLKRGVVSVLEYYNLKVRKDPSLDSETICTLVRSDEVEVDMEESTDDFYKVYLPSGVEGYCMKKFIEIAK